MKKKLLYIKWWLILKFPSLESKWLTDEQQERLAIYRLRRDFKFFGYDTADMSDDQIKEAVIKVSDAASKWGLSIKEVSQAFTNVLKGFDKTLEIKE